MPFNVPGLLAPLHLLINPRLVVPSVVVKGLCPVAQSRFISCHLLHRCHDCCVFFVWRRRCVVLDEEAFAMILLDGGADTPR